MTINVAFKLPEAVVFATDGLSSLIEVSDRTGEERIIANVADVEKLALLSNGDPDPDRNFPVLAMFNGVGSLGNGTILGELVRFDRGRGAGQGPRRASETMLEYATRLNAHLLVLEAASRASTGRTPRPFHLILAGFDPPWPSGLPPHLFEIKWKLGEPAPDQPRALLHDLPGTDLAQHRYGAFYAGATSAVSRFVEGYDPGMPEEAVSVLAGMGGPIAPPGALEELIHEARRVGQPAPAPPTPEETDFLVRKYTRRIVSELFRPATTNLSESLSLQAAINYCVFLAFCAYVDENWSPSRRSPPRVGNPLQVACLPRNGAAKVLCGVRLGVNLGQFGGQEP